MFYEQNEGILSGSSNIKGLFEGSVSGPGSGSRSGPGQRVMDRASQNQGHGQGQGQGWGQVQCQRQDQGQAQQCQGQDQGQGLARVRVRITVGSGLGKGSGLAVLALPLNASPLPDPEILQVTLWAVISTCGFLLCNFSHLFGTSELTVVEMFHSSFLLKVCLPQLSALEKNTGASESPVFL